MSKRALTILIAAVLAVGSLTAVLASTVGGSNDGPQGHEMPNGQAMTAPMPGATEQMDDDSSMPGMDMGR